MCEAISEGEESGRSHLLQARPEGALVLVLPPAALANILAWLYSAQ